MVRVRENTHKALARHVVTTLIVRAALSAATVKQHVMIMVADLRKEAAP